MSPPDPTPPQTSAWTDAVLAAAITAVDPAYVGGTWVKARVGPVRERWTKLLRGLLTADRPARRLPLPVADDRLLGGLDLPATLAAGRPVAQAGLLAEADGGLLIVPMAERLPTGTAARLAAVMDTAVAVVDREGLALRLPTRFGVVALDEGVEPDEAPPPALTDRLALRVDLTGVSVRDLDVPVPTPAMIARARTLLPEIHDPDDAVEAFCSVGAAFGIDSLRAPLLALRTARVLAALAGRDHVVQDDLRAASRLVLAPRATQLPAEPPEAAEPEQPPPPPSETPPSEENEATRRDDTTPREIVAEATRAALPPGLLAALLAGQGRRGQAPAGRAGSSRMTRLRGRPAGAQAGMPGGGARLALVETLRAAAPWQPLRRRETAGAGSRVLVRRDDFRIRRFIHQTETTTIFAVDASGSSALHRMAEAKGAVELLLADCYVRRDQVALVAFRGQVADVLLPPTRSLVRAKRSLAGLPGGGGTPLAAGLEVAAMLADAAARRGQTPVLVVLTDGRANIARDGRQGRGPGEEDALAAAKVIAQAGLSTILVDTSPRPQRQAETLARTMRARYLPLPHADAQGLSTAVKALAGGQR